MQPDGCCNRAVLARLETRVNAGGRRLRSVMPAVLTAFLVVLPAMSRAETFDEAGIAAPLLKIGTGARASAMGEAFTAVADDANAIFWNPAGLGQVEKIQVHFTHNQWFEGMTFEHFGLAVPFMGTWGIAYSLANLGDFAEWNGPGQDSYFGDTFNVNEQVITAAYGQGFMTDSLFLGTAAKYVKENLGGGVGGNTVSMDVGLLFTPWWVLPGVSIGAVVQNIGGELSGFELPLGGRIGVAGRLANLFTGNGPLIMKSAEGDHSVTYPWDPDANIQDLVTVSAEVVVPRTGHMELHGGFEYWLSIVAIRAGYRFRIPGNELGGFSGLTLGLGIRGRSLQFDYGFDYAYAPYGDLGDASRFSLLVAF